MTLPPRSSTSPASPVVDVAVALADDAHLEAGPGPPDRGRDGLGVVPVRRGTGGARPR